MIKKILPVLVFVAWYGVALSQQDTVLTLSLQQAKEYALENNLKLKNSRLDVESARKKIWETTAMGLPHVEGSGSYQYMLTVPELFEQFLMGDLAQDTSFLMAPPDEQQRIIDEQIDEIRQTATFDLTVSQLIFSGAYIVGLQTSKIYKNLSNVALENTGNTVVQNAISSYYLVLIAHENKAILDSTLQNTRKTYADMKAMHEQGFIDQTAVDQLQLTVQMLQNSVSTLERQSEIAERMLKFQIGADFSVPIHLTDQINTLIGRQNLEDLLLKEYSLENDPSYQLLKTQEELAKQNLKLKKTEFLPTVSAYYMYHKNLNEDAVDFQPQDVVGVNVSIPILSSGERLAKVSQAKIEYQKTVNSNNDAAKGLELSFLEAKSNYRSAYEKHLLNKNNVELSKKIYDNTLIKYKEGMASNGDLVQAQNQYLENQGTYYQTIIDLINAKLKIEKALNNIN